MISVCTEVDQVMVSAVNELLTELSATPHPLSEQELRAIVRADATDLLIAKHGSAVVGMLTLVTLRLPSGLVGHIEDVVVSSASRGNGVGKRLVEEALSLAKARGARHVDLTSRPSRVAANALYQSVGFETRQTNVYRFKGDLVE